MSFVFYDTETTGTDKNFDQILQFAAIQTDSDLNEIERFEIRCRLLDHVVPSPGALRVTGIGVETLTDPTLPSHYEMVRSIREKLMSWSPAVFVGYNSMDFDELLLRQALYQTVHPPYLTNTNGNGRADVLPLVQSVAFLDTEVLTIPSGENGKKSFKLDRLAPANGFNHANAHDALADVEATIHICRILKEACPDWWSTFTRFAQKASVLDYISNEKAFVLLEHYFNRPFPFAVSPIAYDEEQTSLVYVLNLAADLEELAALDDDQLAVKLKSSPKPVRKLKASTGPFLMDHEDVPEQVLHRLPSIDMVEQQVAWLDANPDFVSRLMSVYQDIQTQYEPSEHLEQKIYEDFLPKADQKLLEAFHAAPWEERLGILEGLADERYKMLGHRLIHRERPDVLPDALKFELDAEVNSRLVGTEFGGEPWLTLQEALEQTNDLLQAATGEQHELLSNLAAYLTAKLEELAPH